MKDIKAFVASCGKRETQQLISEAQLHLTSLQEAKREAFKELRAKSNAQQPIQFYGQELYVVSHTFTAESWGHIRCQHMFGLSNGSAIVIDVEEGDGF